MFKNLPLKATLAGALLTALALVKTYPLIRHFGTHLPSGLSDPLFVTWILAWDVHALTTDPLNLFNANIFYPVQNTLAFSEHMLAVVPIFAPAYLLTGNPIFAYNVVFFVAFVFSGLAMFLLVHHWTKNFWAACVAGCLFAFAPIRFAQLSQVQLANFYWAPLAFLFLDRFLGHKRWADLAWFAVCYWLQLLASVYLGWFLTIGVAVYVLYHVVRVDRGLLNRGLIPHHAAFIVGSLIVLLPFHLPYYTIQQQWGFSTHLQECIYWSADLVLSFLSPPYLFNQVYLSLTRSYFSSLHNQPNMQMLFPGLVLGFLTVFGSLRLSGRLSHGRSVQLQKLFRIVLMVALLLSLGPFLVILGRTTNIPLPYLLFYYLLPGFHAIRVPGRFALLATLAASVLAALGFLKSSESLRRCWHLKQPWASRVHALLAIFWMGLFTLELGFKPLPLASIPTGKDVPEVYRWLATKPLDGPIIELPLGKSFWEPLRYMYFSTYHWLPLANGSSRFYPPTYTQLRVDIADLPSRESAELLSSIGVKAVIVHTEQLESAETARWQQVNLAELGMQEMARFGSDVVYKLSPSDATPQFHLGVALPDRLPTGELLQLPTGMTIRLGLLAEDSAHRRWVHPSLLGRKRVQIRWDELATGKRFIQRATLEWPVPPRAEKVWSTALPIRTPSSPGRYRLSLDIPILGLKAPPRLVQVSANAPQTSANASQSLSAAYVLEEPSPRMISSYTIDVILQATNTGQSIWLADARDERGKVRLGWRWFKGNDSVPFEEGREDLRYDIFPGQAYRFKTRINAPPEPGEYTLELGLVCESLTWFSDRGVPPFKLAVRIAESTTPSRR